MDSGHRDGQDDQREPNVVRLPREWLGPLDELVPIDTSGVDPHDAPPAASAFWTAEAASVHDALQGPPPRRPSETPDLKRAWWSGRAVRAPRRWLPAVAAAAFVAMAVLGLTERLEGPGRPAARQTDHAAAATHTSAGGPGASAAAVAAALGELAASERTSGHGPVARRSSRSHGFARRASSRHHIPASAATSRHAVSAEHPAQPAAPAPAPEPSTDVASTPAPVTSTPTESVPGAQTYGASDAEASATPAVRTVDTVEVQAEPPGPSGPGGAVGSNCNPKCQ